MLLVVDDEIQIRELLAIGLGDAGFEVTTARDGIQAIAELDNGAARIRALLTDIRLGTGPDGWEVGRHARKLIPNLPIVYSTGSHGHEWPSKGVQGSVLLTKPVRLEKIISVVRTLLIDADDRQAIGERLIEDKKA